MIDKILSGEKTLESRWMQQRKAPWNRIAIGDKIFFAEKGYIRAQAHVKNTIQKEIASDKERREFLKRYASRLGVTTDIFYPNISQSRYVILIELEDIQPTAPRTFSKEGFGPRATWLVFRDACM